MENGNYSGKVVIIGAGNVGSTIAYSLLLNHLCNEIVIIDVSKDKASGEALDMLHALYYSNSVKIRAGDYDECADADIIIVTAGKARKPDQTRTDLAKTNVSIAREIASNIKQYNKNPMMVVVSNPVDILTYVFRQELGIPANRCIGSGTTLDTARLRYACAAKLDIDVHDINLYVCGEHGDTMFPVWSSANAACAPLGDLLINAGVSCDDLLAVTVSGGAEVIRKKGSTFYGISSATTKIVSAILKDENAVLPVAKVQEGEYLGISGVALSLPYVVNKSGIARSIPISMNDAENESFKASAEKLKTLLNEVYA